MMKGNKPPDILKAEFVVSSPDTASCPKAGHPEYAFIGRSNVGKSSLINMLTGHRHLAKTSRSPGKTRLINHFLIDDEWYLVDLPGYGYAKTSKKERERWRKLIHEYLSIRKTLVCTFVLIDIRHEAQQIDLDFMAWMGGLQLPFVLVFTKSDKLGRNKLKESIAAYRKSMLRQWEELPETFATSAKTGLGRQELLEFIAGHNTLYRNFRRSLK